MKISVEITREDFANYNMYWYFKKKRSRLIIILVLMVFGVPLWVMKDRPFNTIEYLLTTLAYIIILGIFSFIYYKIIIKRWKELPSSDGSILGQKTYLITDEGFVEETETSRNLQLWSSIKSVERNNNSLFVFVDKIAAYTIPLRFFENEAEVLSFIEAIEKKLKTYISKPKTHA